MLEIQLENCISEEVLFFILFYFMNTADSQSPIIFSKVHNYAMPITTF